MSRAEYNHIQKLYRKKFLQIERGLEGQAAKVIDELDGKIQRIVRRYVAADGTIGSHHLSDINRELEALSYWYKEQIEDLLDRGLVNSADLAVRGQDAATKKHIKELIDEYSGQPRSILQKAARDPEAPFLLSTRFGDGLPAAIRDRVWNHRWTDGFTLSDRIWKQTGQLKTNLQAMIQQSVSEGRSAVEFSRAVEDYLKKPGPKWTTAIRPAVTDRGSIKYNALRLARTETNQAYHRAQHIAARESDMVKGVKWNLSASHPLDWPPSAAYMGYAEICEYYAMDDHHGLGPGVFPPDRVPFDHPNGLCYLTDVLLAGNELIAHLEKKYAV